MDIRKWLISPKAVSSSASKTGSKKNCDVKSVPELPLSKHSERKSDIKKKSKKRMIILDSDSDEDPLPKSKKSSPKKKKLSESGDIFSSPGLDDFKNGSLNNTQKKPVTLKPITSENFFGDAPVVRSSKKSLDKEKQVTDDSDVIHEDDDFNKTLLQLDEEEKKVKVPQKKKPKGKSPKVKVYDMDFVKHSEKSETGKSLPNTLSKSTEGKKDIAENGSLAAKKKENYMLYRSFLDREGPKALGSKEIPEGEEGCLEGLTFIVTGILESMERDETKSLIEKYGGKVMASLTKNTKYVVIGRDPGPSKVEKAEKFGTKQLDEDGLLNLIATAPGSKGSSKPIKKKPVKRKAIEESFLVPSHLNDIKIERVEEFTPVLAGSPNSDIVCMEKEKSIIELCDLTDQNEMKSSSVRKENISAEVGKTLETTKKPKFEMWVDKYKPSSLKQVIGQQGDRSNAKKLLQWLSNWHSRQGKSKKPAAVGRWNSLDDGTSFKAALLSGSPGIGKTTTAQLACKEAGFDYFELNASDTRSKKNLVDRVSQLLGNQTLAGCFKVGSVPSFTKNHVIIMDEVDGMAGNEDRGGVKELITLIKSSHIPIICICNDRNHPKIRSLSNYCFDLRFQKPRMEQIKAAMMSVAYKEGIKVAPNVLQDVIVASNQDIRQVLHNLSLWSAKEKGLTSDQTKSDIGRGTKNIKMGPFDVLREVFSIGNNPQATIIDKSALFFHDYSLAPLFVQENYVHVQPTEAKGDRLKHLKLLSETADSICNGDLVDKQMRSVNAWSLLPTEAIFASVIPGELMRGHLKQMISFPSWLGKNSNKNHMNRILQELQMHMRMRITGNKTEVALDYLPLLKRALTRPLLELENAGIPDTLKIMNNYCLLREDFDNIIELSLWPEQVDPRTKISTKVKSAFTRSYNKECGPNPYSTASAVKKKKLSSLEPDLVNEENEEIMSEDDNEEDDLLENDAMIKVKKPSKKATSNEDGPSTSKKAEKGSKRGRQKKS